MKTNEDKILFKILQREINSQYLKSVSGLNRLRYARKTKYGYRFLKHKEAQYRSLQEITQRISKKYPEFTIGEIAAVLSEFVNSS